MIFILLESLNRYVPSLRVLCNGFPLRRAGIARIAEHDSHRSRLTANPAVGWGDDDKHHVNFEIDDPVDGDRPCTRSRSGSETAGSSPADRAEADGEIVLRSSQPCRSPSVARALRREQRVIQAEEISLRPEFVGLYYGKETLPKLRNCLFETEPPRPTTGDSVSVIEFALRYFAVSARVYSTHHLIRLF